MNKQKSIAIIGKGVWGKALHHVISQNRPDVRILGRGEAVTEEIVILAVPTQSIRDLIPHLKSLPQSTIIVNTAKGIEEETHLLPHEIVKEMLPDCHYFTLIGPGFAGEVVRDMPTIVNLGYGEEGELFSEIVEILQTDRFRVRPVQAIQILELSAALKNIYAIGCGLADGLGYETNTRIQLVVLAIEEVQKLFASLNLSVGVASTAGTIGDLVLTCNSIESRNFQFGRLLATHVTSEAMEKVVGIVEGFSSLDSLSALEHKSGVKLPLAVFIKEVTTINDPKTVMQRFDTFIKKT
jgi:glycerol-3-phosphate dehydrogenase (NAD(P)+)